MNIYADCLTKNKNGKLNVINCHCTVKYSNKSFIHFLYLFFVSYLTDAFLLSRSEHDLNEIYSILMENLYHVTAAIQEMELNLKTNSSSTVRIETDVTTL